MQNYVPTNAPANESTDVTFGAAAWVYILAPADVPTDVLPFLPTDTRNDAQINVPTDAQTDAPNNVPTDVQTDEPSDVPTIRIH